MRRFSFHSCLSTFNTHTHTHTPYTRIPINLCRARNKLYCCRTVSRNIPTDIFINTKMKTALVFLAILATAYAACDAPNGDCGEKGDCHPKCQWKCDSPVCNQVCEPICEQPRCSTRCQELGCSKCAIKCDKPQCEVRCPVKHCEKGACPKCDTVCKEPQCHTECTNPTPKCESVCEEPLCDWKCHRPADCQKPRCALVCEKSPHCQPQPPKADCCACAKTEVKAEEPKKCCGCEAKKEASASGPAGSAVGCAAYNLQCLSKCKAEKDATACEANCAKLMDLCKQNGGK